jgi:hypothetical protein
MPASHQNIKNNFRQTLEKTLSCNPTTGCSFSIEMNFIEDWNQPEASRQNFASD